MASDKQPSSPLLQLLSSGLQLWVRQQCQSIESLDIALRGSALGLLRGRLEGVQLLARRAVFAHLPIEQVDLVSDAISVQMGNLLKGKPLQLDQPFVIQGRVSFSGEGLNALFSDPHWQGLAEQLREQLCGQLPLLELRIDARQLLLVLQGRQPSERHELRLDVRAHDGTIELSSAGRELVLSLPMDPGITIEQASIAAGMLQLSGKARVSP